MMVEYAKKYPGYGFESNKGYGSAAHIEAIKKIDIINIINIIKSVPRKMEI